MRRRISQNGLPVHRLSGAPLRVGWAIGRRTLPNVQAGRNRLSFKEARSFRD